MGGGAGLYRQPKLTVDLIIEIGAGVVLIERKHKPIGWALPGGFVDYGETLEAAAAREAMEETGLRVTGIRQFAAYSDPARDPRGHTVSMVFTGNAKGNPVGADDASVARVFPWDALPHLVFDHKKILSDYLRQRRRR